MSEQGAALQKYNQELVKNIESLKRRRAELMAAIDKEMLERGHLESTLKELNEKIAAVKISLTAKYETKANYDRIIEETETVYMKILESSQVLLTKIRQESSTLEMEKS